MPGPRSSTAKPTTCHRCGRAVVEFTTDYGMAWRIEAAALPITTDLRDLRARGITVWVFNPDTGCWTSKFGPDRDWRDTRSEHRCTPSE